MLDSTVKVRQGPPWPVGATDQMAFRVGWESKLAHSELMVANPDIAPVFGLLP